MDLSLLGILAPQGSHLSGGGGGQLVNRHLFHLHGV